MSFVSDAGTVYLQFKSLGYSRLLQLEKTLSEDMVSAYSLTLLFLKLKNNGDAYVKI